MNWNDYVTMVMAEYPRLCGELLEMTRAVRGELKGSTLTEAPLKLGLWAHNDNVYTNVGNVDVKTWTVKLHNNFVTFVPDGLSIGPQGRIRLECKEPQKNKLFRGCIFMVTDGSSNRWALGTMENAHVDAAQKLGNQELLQILRTMLL